MNAGRDENNRPTIIYASKNDGQVIVPAKANPVTHGLLVDDGTTGSDGNNNGNAMLDENGVAVWTALASDGSGQIIELYGDPTTGALLVDSI
jgi:hypothetical protein